MKKWICLFCVLCSTLLLHAQQRKISGTITDAEGAKIENASVQVKGAESGTAADARGNFSILVNIGDVLVVSAVNYRSREITITSEAPITVQLTRVDNAMSEVVVTALGIRRKPEEIGYATSRLSPAQVTAGRSFNLAQSLTGKVAGLSVTNTSASVNASPRIVLRGLRSLTGNNTALVVLDGVQVPANTINFINPNDVDRIDIMRGGQAATLFGSEGVNGAIIITSKKGSQKPQVSITHTTNVEQLAYLPLAQNSFGSGSAYGANKDENFFPGENQQFGPRYDGSIRPVGRVIGDGSVRFLPYSSIKNMREKFWDPGRTSQTDLSYRSGDQTGNFYASFQNLQSKGLVEGDNYNRSSLRLNAGRTYGKINLSFESNYTWDNADRTNVDFYERSLNQASWIPMHEYKDWRNYKFAFPDNFLNDYYNNPWWGKDNNRFYTRNTIFNSNLKLTFKPIKQLELTARGAVTNSNVNQTVTANRHVYSSYAQNNAWVNGYNNQYDRFIAGLGRSTTRITPIAGGLSETQANNTRLTADFFANYAETFGNFSLKAILGGQAIASISKSIGVSTNGIGVPDLFNFSNSATGLFTGINSQGEMRKIGGFADATVGYKGLVYLHGTLRRDYTSVFSGPAFGYDDPSFTSYGADVSVILTDIFPSLKNRTIDNIKLRGGYNRNGNDNLSAYGLQTVYPTAAGYPYSGLLGATVGNLMVHPNLTPEIVKTLEAGVEVSLLKNRITFEAGFYTQQAEKQILDVTVSSGSGYQTYRLNAADVTNKGFEFDLNAVLFKNKDWNVAFNANYSYVTNKVNTLYGATGLNSLEYQSPDALASVNAEVGQMFPYLKTTAYLRDAQGRIIIDSTDGWPLRGDTRIGQGTTLPKHNLGIGFNVTYKNFTFTANAEYRGGHVVYHDMGTDMTFTGSGAVTTIYEREQFVWPNSVYIDATGKSVPNTNIAVDNFKAIYQGFGDVGFSRGFGGTGEMYVSSGAFWKLRDVSLTYDVPENVIRRFKVISGLSISAFARNLITLLPSDNWYADPEFSNTNGNSQGINTTLNTPPVRQFGGTIKVIL